MIIKPAYRTDSIQEYYFSRKLKEIAEMDLALSQAGKDKIINLGIGAPDGMPPIKAIEALNEASLRLRDRKSVV